MLRFTGQPTAGDFDFDVVSDLTMAEVADIDDMSPAIVDGAIQDNPGLALDSGAIHQLDYQNRARLAHRHGRHLWHPRARRAAVR